MRLVLSLGLIFLPATLIVSVLPKTAQMLQMTQNLTV